VVEKLAGSNGGSWLSTNRFVNASRKGGWFWIGGGGECSGFLYLWVVKLLEYWVGKEGLCLLEAFPWVRLLGERGGPFVERTGGYRGGKVVGVGVCKEANAKHLGKKEGTARIIRMFCLF